MKPRLLLTLLCITAVSIQGSWAQCSTSNATTCVCEVGGQTNCDLLPDMTISWVALQNYAGGPSEYPQSGAGSNNGRLRVTGSTPNIGHGPLNVRGVDQNGMRWFLCGTDTFSISDPNSQTQFTCPNSQSPKQLIVQRVYHKNGNAMTFTERFAGTMTYHPTHGHNHVDDWATFTLRIEDPNEPNPLNWPIIGTGAKVGFCLMDYYPCTSGSATGHCRTSQEYQGGTALNSSSQFPNYGLGGGSYNCSPISQGISVGYTDVYSESLDGMWVNIPPGTCNGDYWIVMQVDESDHFLEEDESNNWTAIPFTLTQQVPAGGDFAQVTNSAVTAVCDGETVQLTASGGASYLWSTGATTQSITVSGDGTYTCTVTGPCGTDDTDPVVLDFMGDTPPAANGATINAPGTAQLTATGTDLHWYDAEIGGTELGSGPQFTTPFLNQTTSFWVEDRDTQAGTQGYAGKPNNTGGGGYFNSDQWLIFNATEPFELVSVKVYAGSAGTRHFLLTTSAGDLVAEAFVPLVAGEQRVNLGFQVPVGNNLQITVYDDGGTYVRDLWRTNQASAIAYPYSLLGMGAITTSTAGTGYYYFMYDWEVSKPAITCATQRTQAVATVAAVRVAPKVALDGPYDPGTGLMSDALRQAGLVPLVEPFSNLGFTHYGEGGEEAISFYILDTTGVNAMVDWVMVELRDPVDPSIVVSTRSAVLQRDGDVVDLDGSSPVAFGVPAGNYHVSIRHRNHLGCMTSTPLSLSTTATALDFTSPSMPTWGTAARRNVNNKMVLWSGNTVRDGDLKYTGGGNDRDPILVRIGGVVSTATMPGYHVEDVNLDGTTKYTGANNDRDLILQNIGGLVPTNIRSEQLP